MGSNSSRIGDLPKNEYLKKLAGTESVSENDPFWNQLLSFSFPAPTSSTELKLLEEATISVCRSLGKGEKCVCCLSLCNHNFLFSIRMKISPFPSSIPHAFQINFNSLYTALCEQQTSDQATLLLYTLLHQNSNIRTYMLARTDMENLVKENSNVSLLLFPLVIICFFCLEILKNITWYSERALTEISLGSLLILVVIRTIQYNMTRTRDKYLHTNCLAALANMSAQFRSLHQYAAQRIISLFSLLSKKHNKVLEQATQSLRGSLSSNDVPLPDYAQDLNVIEEVIRMMLEIINSCLTNSLHHNPNLVYALLYKRDLFEQFRTHPSFQDIMQNIDLVITFFSSRLLQAGAELSVERVLEIIKQGIVALPKDRLKKFPELKFKYVEEEQPEEFFIPYVWSLVYNSAVGLYWNPQDIQLFTMDSD
uniref:Dymeclin n=1 Tax=Propithecus coquereli TaxID=379532 RepID=A0A2K6ENT3_PROCO